MVLLARRLVESGHDVGFVCLRCDRSMLDPISPDVAVIELPAGLDIHATEMAVATEVEGRWWSRRPDIVVFGAWPFFTAAAKAHEFGTRGLYIDAGAVAQDGLRDSRLAAQRELRRIRQLTLPSIDSVLPVSDFIRTTQTEPDRGHQTSVRTVLLGGDHMHLGMFGGSHDDGDDDAGLLKRLDAHKVAGTHLVLGLGRFEAQGYKNSAAAYDVLRLVRETVPNTRLLLLDAGGDCAVPTDLVPFVDLLGAPDDITLQQVMRRCDAGLSLSLWEGFNLTIAEMQWLDRPPLVFNLGAHPEVVADPWLLCSSVADMAGKTVAILRSQVPVDLQAQFASFRRRLTWARTLDAWEAEIVALAEKPAAALARPCGSPGSRRIVLVDVTNAARDTANPGVIRVVRRLCAELQQHPDLELLFVVWDRQSSEYHFLDTRRRTLLQGYGGPTDGIGLLTKTLAPDMTVDRFVRMIQAGRECPPVLFLPEVLFDGAAPDRIAWGRRQGFRVGAILHDLIAIYHAEFCDPIIRAEFPVYLDALSKTDAIWSNSNFTASEFRRYAGEHGLDARSLGETIWLPGQFGSAPRNRTEAADRGGDIRILCVSTLEPRKNHSRLIEAFQDLRTRRPDLPVRLILVGNRYAAAPEIAAKVETSMALDERIEWHKVLSDEDLARLFEAAAFTVYPSLVEGFGLPVLESLWMGRPCLTYNQGVMAELAADGGCLTTDMTDIGAMSDAIERLATDAALRSRLEREATLRDISSWSDYAVGMARQLLAL